MKKMKDIRPWMEKKNQDNTGREVIFTMKKGEGLKSWTYPVLILISALALAVLPIQAPVHAAVDCSKVISTSTTDSDLDGFTDFEECNGIMLAGNLFPGRTIINPATNSAYARADRLDPDTKDVFVILVQADGGYFRLLPNPLQYVSNPVSQGGLGITVHQISKSQVLSGTVRNATSTQKAAMVTESLDAKSTNPLGFSNTGTPNGLDLSTIYTQRINNFIKSACGSAYGTSNCADSSGVYDTTNNLALTLKYIQHTIDHEVGHVLGPLAPVYNAKIGYHYVSGTNVIMDQSVYYTSKGGKVTFYSGTTYTSADQSGVKLK
jgi:hypothetical protein